MTVSKNLQVKVLNSTFFKEESEFEGIFPSNKTHQHLREILSEYYSLVRQSDVSEEGADRISEILELAEHDRLLDECIDKIDQSLNVQSEIKPNTLSTDELLIQLRKLSIDNKSNDDTAICFSELVRKSQINHELINNFIEFSSSSHHRQTVLTQGRFELFIICWKPGQKTRIHQNLRYSTETLVYKGEVSKTKFKRILKGGKANLVKDNVKTYGEGEWISTDRDELHELANFSLGNLVTIHFKYFNTDYNTREIDYTNNSLIDECFTEVGVQSNKINLKKESYSKLDLFLDVTY